MERIGKYEIVRELGRGAMGKVLLARHPIMDKTVAIKVVHAPDAHTPDEVEHLRKRLFDEARRAGALSHPNIVTIYDVDVTGEMAFIVMEFIEGDTLEDRLAAGAPMNFDAAVSIIGQIAGALDAAHARAIIHRDIKPANIMLTDGNRVKVADFGIAKNLAEAGMTRTGLVLGTPYYMAPEQILGKPIDGRADQFALAVIAYRMLAGVRPFDGDSVTAIMYQIVNGQPKSMCECNKTLAPPTAQIVAKALSKDPADRYATCSEFAHALLKGTAPAIAAAPPVIAATQFAGSGVAAAAAVAPARMPVAPAPAPVRTPAKRSFVRSAVLGLVYFLLPIAVLAVAASMYIARTTVKPEAQPAPVVQAEPQQPPARVPARRSDARKPRRQAAAKTEPAPEQPVEDTTAPAATAGKKVADPGPEVQLIEDKKPAGPNVPRVFDKR